MTPLLYIIVGVLLIGWISLSLHGIKQGTNRKIVVFSSPLDCVMTALLLAMALVAWIPNGIPPKFILLLQCMTIAGTILWLIRARHCNSRWRDILVVVPTKVFMVVVAAVCIAIVISSAMKVFAPKTGLSRTLIDGVLFLVGLFCTYSYFRLLFQLMPGAPPPRPIPKVNGVWARLMQDV